MGEVRSFPRTKRERVRQLHRYGTAAGLEVVLVTDPEAETVAPLRVSAITGSAAGIEALAVFPNSDEGRAGADALAGAVLHALRLAECGGPPGAIA